MKPSAPKILLFGGTGQIGWELHRTLAPLGEVVAPERAEVDITDYAQLRATIRRLRPGVIVNAAAYTDVEKAEVEVQLAEALNADAPGVMAEEAAESGALMVHFSSDYVFDGKKGAPYLESDEPNPLNEYGRTKLAGELAIKSTGCNYLIFRTSWIYGARGENFLMTMQRLFGEREEVRVVDDQVGAPTWSRMVSEAAAFAICSSLRRPAELCGTYNLTAAGETTWHGFATAILEEFRGQARTRVVTPISTRDFPSEADRPLYSILSNEKLEETFGLALPMWNLSLELLLSGLEGGQKFGLDVPISPPSKHMELRST